MVNNLSRERALRYFDYDPLTGELRFKRRPDTEFKDEASIARHLKLVGTVAGSINSEGYIKVHIDGEYYAGHKVIWLMQTGEWVDYPDHEVGHFDGDRANNRWANLRKATKSDSQRNGGMRINNTSGVHGVNWKPVYTATPGDGRWVARIWNGPKHVYLGSFKDIRDAMIARRAAERALGFTGSDRPPRKIAKQKAAAE